MAESIGIVVLVLLLLLAAVPLWRRLSVPRSGGAPATDWRRIRSRREGRRKVILLMADSLLASAAELGIARGMLPNLGHLRERGQFYPDAVSSFPTMSVAIDSTLLTGTYPDVHRVPGLIWFSSEQKRVVNYGTGPMEIIRHGVDPVLYNALIGLNESHLSPATSTIYEELARKGLTSGSINGIVYRGTTAHRLRVPPMLSRLTLLPEEIAVRGPELLVFGAFSDPLDGRGDLSDSLPERLGFNNAFAVDTAIHLIRTGNLPDFLYVYLPDLDKPLHEHGPASEKKIGELDRQLGALFEAFGSPERAAEQAVIVLIGDSGVSQVRPAEGDPVVKLFELLGEFRLLPPGGEVTDDIELVLAVNETMAYVYRWRSRRSLREIAAKLTSDRRIDFAAWVEDDWIVVRTSGSGKELRYRRGGDAVDAYGQRWTLDGEAAALDLAVRDGGAGGAAAAIAYGSYPDGLQRLYGALHSHEGDFLVVTAKPGYELADRSSPAHKGGGAHGSMHREESLLPLFIYGTDKRPEHLRLADMKAFLLQLLTDPDEA